MLNQIFPFQPEFKLSDF